MVYVPAWIRQEYPDIPWKDFQRLARAVKDRCADKPNMWLLAEEADEGMALWAASAAKCTEGRGKWLVQGFAQRRAWLDELQGRRPAAAERVN